MDKKDFPEELLQELIDIMGQEKALILIKEKKYHVNRLRMIAFEKRFKKQFGINIRVVVVTFVLMFALWIVLKMING